MGFILLNPETGKNSFLEETKWRSSNLFNRNVFLPFSLKESELVLLNLYLIPATASAILKQ